MVHASLAALFMLGAYYAMESILALYASKMYILDKMASAYYVAHFYLTVLNAVINKLAPNARAALTFF